MKQILLVTGNERKVWQAESALKKLNISVEALDVDVPEIQSADPEKISMAKAEAAHGLLRRPLVICDHSWAVAALRGFPGGYMKDVNQWFTAEDWLALMKDKADRSLTLTETVVFTDGSVTEVFAAKYPASFVLEPRGKGKVPMEQVVMFDGEDETIAQRIDKHEHTRNMNKSAWQKFGQWYANS